MVGLAARVGAPSVECCNLRLDVGPDAHVPQPVPNRLVLAKGGLELLEACGVLTRFAFRNATDGANDVVGDVGEAAFSVKGGDEGEVRRCGRRRARRRGYGDEVARDPDGRAIGRARDWTQEACLAGTSSCTMFSS